ncbi:MAG: hypothetical protein JWO80_5402 [Bryobacterales bacterium]|nr:hypothetical protein [Bryobacterales bacterium]
MYIALPFIKIQNRVADHLPGTMIRHIPAAIRLMERDSRAAQHLFAGQKVFPVCVAPKRDYVRMLDKQYLVGNQPRLTLPGQPFLQFRRTNPIHGSQIADFQQSRH